MTRKSATPFALPPQMLSFLERLSQNNNKIWFDEHRYDYDHYFVEPLKDLVEAMGATFRGLLPGLRYEPRINGSLFRINRDVRFSKDKRPYKTNGAVFLWVGPNKKMESPGLYFHIEPDKLIIGSGIYQFTPSALDLYRRSVDGHGDRLAKAIAKAEKGGYTLEGEKLKKVPAGFDNSHKYSELLKHKGVYVGKEFPATKAVSGDLIRFLKEEYAPTLDVVTALEKILF